MNKNKLLKMKSILLIAIFAFCYLFEVGTSKDVEKHHPHHTEHTSHTEHLNSHHGHHQGVHHPKNLKPQSLHHLTATAEHFNTQRRFGHQPTGIVSRLLGNHFIDGHFIHHSNRNINASFQIRNNHKNNDEGNHKSATTAAPTTTEEPTTTTEEPAPEE